MRYSAGVREGREPEWANRRICVLPDG